MAAPIPTATRTASRTSTISARTIQRTRTASRTRTAAPIPASDRDRILDKDDKCPNEPETYNGYQDADGCPDRGRVIVTDTSIEILDIVYFEYDKAIIKEGLVPDPLKPPSRRRCRATRAST